MTISIQNLDSEQQAALSQLSQYYDSAESWAEAVLTGLIDEQVVKNIDARGAQLLGAAKSLPKEKRLAYTEQATQLLVTISES